MEIGLISVLITTIGLISVLIGNMANRTINHYYISVISTINMRIRNMAYTINNTEIGLTGLSWIRGLSLLWLIVCMQTTIGNMVIIGSEIWLLGLSLLY